MQKQTVEILSKTEKTNSQIKGEQQLMELNKAATLISSTFDEYTRKKAE